MLDDYCFKAKNLYNCATYRMRQTFFSKEKFPSYPELDKLLRVEAEEDYRSLGSSSAAQQLIRTVTATWKGYLAACKEYKKNPSRFQGKPRIPQYLDKNNGRFTVQFTYNAAKVKDGYLQLPKTYQGFTVKSKVKDLQVVRIVPKAKHIVLEIIYAVPVVPYKEDNGKYMSIDLGVNNLATVVTNTDMTPVIINGKAAKSVNQYYNKQRSHYQSVAKRMNNTHTTNRITRLNNKRNNIMDSMMHQASRKIVNMAVAEDISVIVIGQNKGWKQNISYKRTKGIKVKSRKNARRIATASRIPKKLIKQETQRFNQNFTSIPYHKLIERITYKAKAEGIKVVVTEESYTSGTSFLDNEMPTKENYKADRRIHRGLFVSNKGVFNS
jgi:putative transposase